MNTNEKTSSADDGATALSQDDEIVALETQVAELERQLLAARRVNEDDNVKLTYEDVGIPAEDIFGMIESYTLTSAVIILTKEKLAKIIRHFIVHGVNRRFGDGRTFLDVLDLRSSKLKSDLAKLREAGDQSNTEMALEIVRLEISVRNLAYIRDSISASPE